MATYQGRKVYFYKRAQIFATDLHAAFGSKGWGRFEDLDELTAFADYKLPQVLRHVGILCYAEQLAHKVDQKILSLASRQIAGFLFQPLIREILDNPEGGGGFDRVLATSRDLYRNLEASASYHRRLLEKCLQRL